MQNLAVVRVIDNSLVWYPPGAGEQPRPLDSPEARAGFRATLASARYQACFAVPGAAVRLMRLDVSAEEKKHLDKALPFLLEEQVADDIEQLHFAVCALEKLSFGVALCRRQAMADWNQQLAELPDLPQWLPEPLLLPWQPGEWCVLVEPDQVLVRSGACEGFTVEAELLLPLLAAAEAAAPPQQIIVYGQDQASDLALFPAGLQSRLQWRRGNLCSALMLSGDQHPLNLRQGDYAPRLPLARWWQQWRVAAAALAVAFVLQLLATWADYRSLARQNLALRSAVEASYRQAVPDGALVDAERQLSRQLAALRGDAGGSGFVRLLEQAGGAIADQSGTSIVSINYNQRGGEMRMNILADDFAAVEQLRAGLVAAGLAAEMESSSAQGQRVRARIRVGGAG
ncbi:type II secretion system protein GspL [Kineobactrum salinum]|uniref:Type II secretion system protein L n=1 Tax=Kineobactrum salinum TaxID=2708301 RepID=A0A6C0U656_9GAMM|nr:type II secretion system protein GspL [Kineobactrum salinum]QIB66417.1 type II secretion system protein GspL [Kineobactrum salinum]